jgi:hypothetical protein
LQTVANFEYFIRSLNSLTLRYSSIFHSHFFATDNYLRNRDLIKNVIATRYRHSSTRPCSLCLPDSVKGLKRAVILSPIKLMALVTSDATNGTNNTVAIIATIKMTIRAAKLKFMAPPSPIWDPGFQKCVFTSLFV